MRLRCVLFFIILHFNISNIWSQGVYRAGVLPQLNLNVPLTKDWRLNTKVESRQLFFEGKFNKNFKSGYRYDLTDIAFIASRKSGANSSFGFGYMMRFRENSVIHRFIQQYSIVKKYDQLRLAHRISSDQTIDDNNSVQLRLRYRIGLERALSGKDVDPKEFYLKVNNEYIVFTEGTTKDFEVRLIPALGYAFTEYNKFEGGIDYRVNDFMSGASRNQFWLYLGWFISR